jgi:hypothetical protein
MNIQASDDATLRKFDGEVQQGEQVSWNSFVFISVKEKSFNSVN